jgi:hypothetical protein
MTISQHIKKLSKIKLGTEDSNFATGLNIRRQLESENFIPPID